MGKIQKEIIGFCLLFGGLNAQEKQGIANSNYLSTESIFLNPASSVDSKTYMQLKLGGAGIFAMSNLVYLPDFSIYGHAKNEPYINCVKFSTLNLPKFVFANASVDGPAFVISKRNYGAGFFIHARSVLSAHAASAQLVNALVNQENGATNEMSLDTKNTRVANMSWIEYGGNFGMIVKHDRKNLWAIGANLRYLSGINLAYINMTQLKGFYNDSMVNVEDLEGKIRYSAPALNSGKGIGADIGITYKKMLGDVKSYYPNSVRCNCKTLDYKYKVGLSLRDLGYLRFNKTTSSANVTSSGTYYTNRNDTTYLAAVSSLLNTTFSTKPILASLPTAVVAQLDWNFENNIYLNAILVKNLVPNRVTGVQSTNLLAITPRFELQQFEIAVPLSFQRYLYPQVGLALRYRTFVVGVDNVFPFLLSKNTYGAGVYVSAGISLFKNPACRKKQRRVDRCPTKTLTGI